MIDTGEVEYTIEKYKGSIPRKGENLTILGHETTVGENTEYRVREVCWYLIEDKDSFEFNEVFIGLNKV